MASIKLVLHEKVYSDNTQAVMLRLIYDTIDGRQFKRKLICRVDAKYWNPKDKRIRKTHPNYIALNNRLSDEFNQAEGRLLELQRRGLPISADAVFKTQQDPTGLLAHCRTYSERLEGSGAYHTVNKYRSHIKRLSDYLGGKEVPMDQINEEWLLKLSRWLREQGAKSDNTIHRRMAYLKTIFSDARRRGLTSADPFRFLEFKKATVRKPKLTAAQIQTLEELPLTGKMALARDTFLLQFYLYGSRISDVLLLRPENVCTGPEWRVEYVSFKTADVISVRLSANAIELVKKYYEPDNHYLMPWLKFIPPNGAIRGAHEPQLVEDIEAKTASVNKLLKKIASQAEISVNLTTHIARHTFATLADQKVSDKRLLSKALGHSKFSTTEVYLAELRQSDVNDAMDLVFT